jgi:AraC-like DNA-binding protein
MTTMQTMSFDAPTGGQWTTLMSEAFPYMEWQVLEEPFSATVCIRELGTVRVSEATTNAALLVRSDRDVDPVGPPSLFIVSAMEGTVHVEQMGRSVTLGPGQLAVMGLQQPAVARIFYRCRSMAIEIPRNLVPFSTAELVDVVATAVRGELVDITLDLAHSLLVMRSEMTVEQGVDCGFTLVNLAAALVRQLHAERSDAEPGMIDRVKMYIDRRLADPALSPRRVADGMHISLRFLHRLFEGEPETVTAYIRRRRLEGIRDDLANPDLARLTVSDVAARWGLIDPSRFGQLFRRTFGEAPSQYRRRLLTPPPAARH